MYDTIIVVILCTVIFTLILLLVEVYITDKRIATLEQRMTNTNILVQQIGKNRNNNAGKVSSLLLDQTKRTNSRTRKK